MTPLQTSEETGVSCGAVVDAEAETDAEVGTEAGDEIGNYAGSEAGIAGSTTAKGIAYYGKYIQPYHSLELAEILPPFQDRALG